MAEEPKDEDEMGAAGAPAAGDASEAGEGPAAPVEPRRTSFKAKPPVRREALDAPPQRGLKSVEASRAERKKIKRPPVRVVGWFVLVTAVALVFYFRFEAIGVDRTKQKLLADQRAVESELGKLWYPLRDKTDRWAVELAGAAPDAPDVVDKEALAGFSFQKLPGLYLRVHADQTGDPEILHRSILRSSRDGFTACLMQTGGADAHTGAFCEHSSTCKSGELCNEHNQCVEPGTPFNLGLAYRSLSILSPDWVREVQDASSELHLRALRGTFEDAERIEFPIAIRLLTQAKFFLVLVDERPSPKAVDKDAGPKEEDPSEGKLAPVRIGLWRLSDDKLLLRMRREAVPNLQEAPGAVVADARTRAAMMRQAQSCELAQHVRCAVGDPGASCQGR